jgi:hypothetical protein
MTNVIELRLRNQKLSRTALRRPEDVVAWLGAVQSQDYFGAKWGVAQRASGVVEADIDRAFDEGRLLRTHILRPTWHFVPAADLRWMLSLSAPRVHAVSATYYRRLALEPRTLSRVHTTFERALRGGRQLTRQELRTALGRAGIDAATQRLAYIVMHAELEQVITSGPRRGKQFTYMLVDDRAPRGPRLDANAALTELARRYFTSHGPATVRDFSWWSGLTMRQTRTALEALGTSVEKETIGDLTYWLVPSRSTGRRVQSSIYLLPNYDEYLIAYRDRGNVQPLMTTANANRTIDIYAHILVADGGFGGTWRCGRLRAIGTAAKRADGEESVSVVPLHPLTRRHSRDLAKAVERFAAFLGCNVRLTLV